MKDHEHHESSLPHPLQKEAIENEHILEQDPSSNEFNAIAKHSLDESTSSHPTEIQIPQGSTIMSSLSPDSTPNHIDISPNPISPALSLASSKIVWESQTLWQKSSMLYCKSRVLNGHGIFMILFTMLLVHVPALLTCIYM
jgi:hypothetical protein